MLRVRKEFKGRSARRVQQVQQDLLVQTESLEPLVLPAQPEQEFKESPAQLARREQLVRLV